MYRYTHDDNCPTADTSEERRRVGRRSLLILGAIVACVLASALLSVAQAQTVTRSAVLTWQAPTACEGGSAITNCPVLGYSIQKLIGTTWTEVGTTTASVRTFTHSNLPIGTHTYRVLATSDAGASKPSNEVTKIIDVPGAPGSVVITVTVTVTP